MAWEKICKIVHDKQAFYKYLHSKITVAHNCHGKTKISRQNKKDLRQNKKATAK
jgi:hypothetical protein